PEQVERIFASIGDQIAAIIVEPVAGNMNCVPGTRTFLNTLRTVCNKYESILIFDEVISGFRVALGGAQSLYKIKPDLTVLGKVIGGGMPVGAFGGLKKIMDHLAPDGPVYQAGTLSGNPVAMSAGLATLKLISVPGFFEKLSVKTKMLADGLRDTAGKAGIPFTTNTMGGMFGLFFSGEKKITTLGQLMNYNQHHFRKFFHGMLRNGIYLAPSAYEAGFVSSKHTVGDINQTVRIAYKVMKELE
ncbi:MAG: aminotransferase class III-fold pyridoxal phosphate-dependent enzyme, partial [Gammaproteobacteria bacterium]